jgi:uncharacterized protein YukE
VTNPTRNAAEQIAKVLSHLSEVQSILENLRDEVEETNREAEDAGAIDETGEELHSNLEDAIA